MRFMTQINVEKMTLMVSQLFFCSHSLFRNLGYVVNSIVCQNLSKTKIKSCIFRFSFCASTYFIFSLKDYSNKRKMEKLIWGFRIPNIKNKPNFEAFLQTINFIAYLKFLKSKLSQPWKSSFSYLEKLSAMGYFNC